MPLVALALVLLLPFVLLALMPLSIVLRYRASTARRLARGWVATINVLALALSVAFFLTVAATTSLWVPRALTYTTLGLAGGIVLGLVGLWLSRWEATARGLHYTPSRSLVLAIMLVVASRMVYGLWRAWHAWHRAANETSWLAASGAAGSLAAGAVVLGYYLAYNAGVWARFKRHKQTSSARDGSR
jgi:hypothetical protein